MMRKVKAEEVAKLRRAVTRAMDIAFDLAMRAGETEGSDRHVTDELYRAFNELSVLAGDARSNKEDRLAALMGCLVTRERKAASASKRAGMAAWKSVGVRGKVRRA